MGIRKIATTGDQLKQFYPRRNQENIKQYINRLESYKKYYDITVNKGKSYFNPWHQGRAYSLANFLPERDIDFELTLDKDPVRPVWANKKSTEFHLPGHNYIGPGTNLDDKSKYPVDLDDSIAKEHDEAYLEANSVDKVKQADKHAIHDFVSDFIDTGNPHSAIGSIGLGIKHLSGSNYGLNMDRGNKRKAEADSTSDDSNKKQTISNPAMVAKPEAVQQPTNSNASASLLLTKPCKTFPPALFHLFICVGMSFQSLCVLFNTFNNVELFKLAGPRLNTHDTKASNSFCFKLTSTKLFI